MLFTHSNFKMSSDLTKEKLRIKVFGFEICDHIREKFTVSLIRTNNLKRILLNYFFKIFKISVKLNRSEWTVERRYNEFDRLNSEIKKENPTIKLYFPGKKLFGDNFDTDFINKRMGKLDTFLNNALDYPSILKMYRNLKKNYFLK